MTKQVSTAHLVAMMQDARIRTLELVDDLDSKQLMGPKLQTVNPLRWEIGHVAYFYEYFIARQLYGEESQLGDLADQLYDSIAVSHETRWDLPLLSIEETLKYMQDVMDRLIDRLGALSHENLASEQDSFIYQFGVFHEDMHTEAFLWARQTLAYPTPKLINAKEFLSVEKCGALDGLAEVCGGKFSVGAPANAPFLFDNEKYAHEVVVEPFKISRAPVTNIEFAAFVHDGGYENDKFWCAQGLAWRNAHGAKHPGYWIADGARRWKLRHFDRMILLPEFEPVCHVNWYEASAYCRWIGQRLPTEIEWEVAALGEPASDGSLAFRKRRYPWGDFAPTEKHANLDGRAIGCVDVAALPDGDSAFGCRQMVGNIWEWTADVFQPFPEFAPDAYKEYSMDLFGSTKVLRGGAWPTRSRMIHGTYRNFFRPEQWNIFSGFRTCAI